MMRAKPAMANEAPQDTIRVRLVSISYAARDVNLFEFAPVNDAPLPPAAAGAHIDVYLPNQCVRQYSLVLGGRPNTYVVGVKREARGRGGSLCVHEDLRVGMELTISVPRNNFPLQERATHSVFIAGGIGITPIWSMIQRVREIGGSWQLHFASRSPEHASFLQELRQCSEAHFHFDSENEGRPLDVAAVLRDVPADADIYCCGPGPMLEAFESAAAERPRALVHVEYFSPKQESADGGFNVRLSSTGELLTVEPGASILDTLLDAGIAVSFSCTEGICGACQVGVVDGIPDHRDNVLTDEERAANNCMMVCCSGSKSDILTLDL